MPVILRKFRTLIRILLYNLLRDGVLFSLPEGAAPPRPEGPDASSIRKDGWVYGTPSRSAFILANL